VDAPIDVLARCLPGSSGARAGMREVEVPALSARGLIAKHRITRIRPMP
jgi:hypothetical protein